MSSNVMDVHRSVCWKRSEKACEIKFLWAKSTTKATDEHIRKSLAKKITKIGMKKTDEESIGGVNSDML